MYHIQVYPNYDHKSDILSPVIIRSWTNTKLCNLPNSDGIEKAEAFN